MSALLAQSFRLPDGRNLMYAEYGLPHGKPVFYFHGQAGSRLEPRIFDGSKLVQAGLRLIACDRPGMGGSDFQPGRGFLHWPADIVLLADHLELGKFAVWGISGGGGYVLACAHSIPERLSAAVIVSGAGPMDSLEARAGLPLISRVFWMLAARSVPLTGLLLKTMMPAKADPARIREQTLRRMLPLERAFFEQPGRLEDFMASGLESMRQGMLGIAWETHMYASPWDFRLEEVHFPVHLLHGEADLNVPVAVARKIAATVPGCQAAFYAGEGHIAVLANHMDEMIRILSSAAY
jgi:pimeloyl-ACP methyl ester carboxylesterase